MPTRSEIGGLFAVATAALGVLCCTSAPDGPAADGLAALSLRELRRQAERAGVAAQALDEALESADPKAATIQLTPSPPRRGREQALAASVA